MTAVDGCTGRQGCGDRQASHMPSARSSEGGGTAAVLPLLPLQPGPLLAAALAPLSTPSLPAVPAKLREGVAGCSQQSPLQALLVADCQRCLLARSPAMPCLAPPSVPHAQGPSAGPAAGAAAASKPCPQALALPSASRRCRLARLALQDRRRP